MCGLVGFTDYNNSFLNKEEIIKKMNTTLINRGPDEEGYYIKDTIALGHKRLIVRDKVFGKQPMIENYSEDEYVISYNGQIYNSDDIKKILVDKRIYF